ncbi:hypothetical protein A3B57_01105 [Microgenomates group bacterium RIFCSPLOWO2_01_FULL_47_10]|nr:MAG: hypothetical protein A3B57_01105 [Microgenomates group bacterium RIFCSPLOWO2_01_FULL_47_10]
MKNKPYRLRLAALLLILLTVGAGLVIVPVEISQSSNPNLTTIENGLWWSVSTITSVGYGDFAPTSSLGKLIGAFLEVAGVTMFGIVIALITVDMFRKEQQYYWSRTTERFNRLEEKLDAIEKKQSFTIKK